MPSSGNDFSASRKPWHAIFLTCPGTPSDSLGLHTCQAKCSRSLDQWVQSKVQDPKQNHPPVPNHFSSSAGAGFTLGTQWQTVFNLQTCRDMSRTHSPGIESESSPNTHSPSLVVCNLGQIHPSTKRFAKDWNPLTTSTCTKVEENKEMQFARPPVTGGTPFPPSHSPVASNSVPSFNSATARPFVAGSLRRHTAGWCTTSKVREMESDVISAIYSAYNCI